MLSFSRLSDSVSTASTFVVSSSPSQFFLSLLLLIAFDVLIVTCSKRKVFPSFLFPLFLRRSQPFATNRWSPSCSVIDSCREPTKQTGVSSHEGAIHSSSLCCCVADTVGRLRLCLINTTQCRAVLSWFRHNILCSPTKHVWNEPTKPCLVL